MPSLAHADDQVAVKKTKGSGARGLIRKFASAIGPGVITGAADDDPSGIATYSVAGAQLGTSLLWTAFITWPLMAAVQMMCARIGMVTGKGLASAISDKFPKAVVALCIGALLIANIINIGSDLAGMADAAAMLSGLNSQFFLVIFAVGISIATVKLRYYHIATTLKWLCLSLFAYVISAFALHPHWLAVAHAALVPAWPRGKEAWSTLVAILGTTISPYLFFWQAAQEVEEEKACGRKTVSARRGATGSELHTRAIDVGMGTFFSNLVMFFIILTAALALHQHGMTKIETSSDAAQALRPLAGRFTATLFTIGILGVGFLAIPTLTGSAAYAFCDSFHWRQGLDKPLRHARSFYAVILLSTLAAVAIDFARISPVKALYWTAVINGLLAPFLLVAILWIASDRKLMRGQPSSLLGRVVVGATTLLMFGAGVAMFLV